MRLLHKSLDDASDSSTGGMFGNAIAATEAFAAGGGENFKAAIVELHEQIEKVLILAAQI